MHAGINPPGPEAGTPPPGAEAGTHLRMQTPPPGPDAGTPPPGADPWDQAPPRPDTPPSAVHAGRYGQQSGATHPTGMQTC